MKTREFLGKFVSGYLIGNLIAMAVVTGLLFLSVKFGLELYTHHGEGIKVPDLSRMQFNEAKMLLESDGLRILVGDSGYNKRLPADCVLMQSPGAGTFVKSGHIIYVTVNAPSSPTFALPDVVDNSSYREAEAKLTAMGFRLLPPKYTLGEKDWVYGILCRGRRVGTGDMVSVEQPLTLIVGNGQYDETTGDIDFTDPDYGEDEEFDTFEEIPLDSIMPPHASYGDD